MRKALLVLAAAMTLGAASESWSAGKPAPSSDWRCKIVFRDAADDTIQSDGATYTDGVGGVKCYVVVVPGATHDGWLYMNITNTRRSPSTRYIRFVGQSFEGASYVTFNNHQGGTFEVKEFARPDPGYPNLAHNVKPFRALLSNSQFAGGNARMDGDSNFTGGEPSYSTSSVFVRQIDACSWTVTSYTTEEPTPLVSSFGERGGTRVAPRVMRIWEGDGARGEFPMPFQATVTIIGNKVGCPAQ